MSDKQPLWRLEPTNEMIAAACRAGAACSGKSYPEDFSVEEQAHARHTVREELEAALATQGEGDGLPAHHPGTCGTGYLTDERALRLIERLAQHGKVDSEAMEVVIGLCRDAGVPFARMALRRQEAARDATAALWGVDEDDLPF